MRLDKLISDSAALTRKEAAASIRAGQAAINGTTVREPDRKVEQDLCWKVYSYVTEEYEPDITRLRDWVSNPKPNGYESLHITVKNAAGAYIEVQIRSKRMDDTAENGLASHWSYKGVKSDGMMDSWLKSVRYQLEHPYEEKPEDMPLRRVRRSSSSLRPASCASCPPAPPSSTSPSTSTRAWAAAAPAARSTARPSPSRRSSRPATSSKS